MSRRSIDLGKIMVTLAEGVWNARTSYEVLTAVYHDGDGYISRRDNIGVEPGTDDSVWYRIVKQGTIPNITFDEDGNMYADDVLVTTVFADVIERSREAVENVEQWSQVGDTMVEEEMRRRHKEDERIAAENERVLNEKNRRTAEENRARNEAGRESNESSREIAEVQREERFEEAMRQAASTMRKGDPGKSAYEVAVDNGFEGTEVEWLADLTGSAGDSAYAIAVQQGFVGTKDQWLASLVGPQGKSAYQVAVDNGFEGTISEWLLSLKGAQGDPGRGITSVVQTTSSSESEGDNVITVTLSDGTTATFTVKNGKRGLQGIPGAANVKYKQVEALPTASAATMDFIYLVESATPGVYDMSYTEEDGGSYSWKSLGTTAIQLSDYASKTEVSQLDQEVTEKYGDYEDVPEYIRVETDANGKILGGRKADGTLFDNVGIQPARMVLNNAAANDIKEALANIGFFIVNDWSDKTNLDLPIPRTCAILNIGTNSQAETKSDDIQTTVQYWDMDGNYFKKSVTLNAQGQSSLNYKIKNQAIDFNDGTKIRFGGWVPCDSFHVKKYFIDVFRGQCVVGYWLTEQVYNTRQYGKRRPWDYIIDTSSVSSARGSFKKDFNTGALAHPDGFPVHVFFNGVDAGVYAFMLKKDRNNYYCKKDDQTNIILDGSLGTDFFTAGGTISSDLWSDFEVRNPKIATDINGDPYDGDNPTEPSNDYATAKANIARLTTAIAAVNAEATAEAKKAKFQEYFNLPFIIDYDLIAQVIYHYDGFRKNWIWLTNDGDVWAPTLYDMDSIFGQNYDGNEYVPTSTETVLGTSADLPTSFLKADGIFWSEVKARYKALRDAKVFDVDNITGLLDKWLGQCGYDNLKKDIEEIATSPYLVNGSVVKDESNNPILVPNTPSYRDGSLTYQYQPTTGGWYNSVARVRNWLTQRLAMLDEYYEYN